MEKNINNTQFFTVQKEPELQVSDVLEIVYKALKEKGYNPVNQIVGYIMSGDPTYITSHNNARSLIMKVERDELVVTAQGVEIVRRKSPSKLRQTLARIEEIIAEYKVDRIVLGYPKNMNNTEGERCEKTKEFGDMLARRTGLEVIYWDERLTTVAADRSMMETGIRRENRKEFVDEIAAIFILQGYLDYLSNSRS